MPADHKQARQGILYREGQSRSPDESYVDEYMNSASVRPRNVRWRDETAHRDRAGVRYGDQYIKQIEAIYGGEGLVEPAGSGRSEQGSLVRTRTPISKGVRCRIARPPDGWSPFRPAGCEGVCVSPARARTDRARLYACLLRKRPGRPTRELRDQRRPNATPRL